MGIFNFEYNGNSYQASINEYSYNPNNPVVYNEIIENGSYLLSISLSVGTAIEECTISQIILHIIPVNSNYIFKTFLESSTFYRIGENIGHAEPNGEWIHIGNSTDQYNIYSIIFNYYLSTQK